MAIRNFWHVLLWLATAGIFLNIMIPKVKVQVMGKTEYRWQWPAAILLAAPYAIWSGFRRDGVGDTAMYRDMFFDAPSSLSELSLYLAENTKDKGYSILTVIFKSIAGNEDVLFFLLIAIFQMCCLVYFFRTYSSDYLMSLFLFVVSTDYITWMFNGMRQFIVIAAILAAFGLMLKKKYVSFICIVLILSLIHGSALIMIPFAFIVQGKAWNKKTLFFGIGIIFAIMFIEQFTTVLDGWLVDTQYNDILTNEVWQGDDGSNVFRILVYSVPTIFSLIGKKYIDEVDDPVVNMCTNCTIITAAMYWLSGVTSGIYVTRLGAYTLFPGYCLLPWLISHMFTRASARIITLFMIVAYLCFFYFQMHFAWGMI